MYSACVRRLKCPLAIEDPWIEALMAGDHAAFATLLLSQLPRIQLLNIDAPHGIVPSRHWIVEIPGSSARIARSMDPIGCQIWFLSSLNRRIMFVGLQEVSLRGIVSNINSIAAALRLPSIRNPHLGGIVDDDAQTKVEPGTSIIEHLTLRFVRISLRCLIKIVKLCRKLRRCSYRSPIGGRFPQGLFALFFTLQTFKDSLEEIEMLNLPARYTGGGLTTLFLGLDLSSQARVRCSIACLFITSNETMETSACNYPEATHTSYLRGILVGLW